mgnify:CR=1 FL=1
MSIMTRLEEEKMAPVISARIEGQPEGVTIDDLRKALNEHGYAVTRERLFTLVALFQCAGACSLRVKGGEIRFVPAGVKPVFIH